MKLITTSLLAMVFFTTISCSKEEPIETVEESNFSIDVNLANETDWEMANEILQLVNDYRQSQGLSTIKRDQQYASAYAVDHTQYMIEKNKISHDNFAIRFAKLQEQVTTA